MELSQEQKDRIKQNRERALEIQRQRKLQLETSALAEDNNDKNSRTPTKHSLDTSNDTSNESNMKRSKGDPSNARTRNGTERGASVTEGGGVNGGNHHGTENGDSEYHTDEIEAFEENASEYITKQEAMKVYCLPQGTLDVCRNGITKPNPKHATWSDMKLYLRKEIRFRAYQRYGGMVGLIEERNRRNHARLQKDMELSKDIFK